MNNPEHAVREANRRFYAAFEALDMDEMEGVWLHDDSVQCVHPGWEVLLGWEEVGESRKRIFTNTKRVKVEISPVRIRVEGEVACTEHVTSVPVSGEGFDDAFIQATNVFVLRDSSWQLALRHASLLPPREAPRLQ